MRLENINASHLKKNLAMWDKNCLHYISFNFFIIIFFFLYMQEHIWVKSCTIINFKKTLYLYIEIIFVFCNDEFAVTFVVVGIVEVATEIILITTCFFVFLFIYISFNTSIYLSLCQHLFLSLSIHFTL